MSKYEELSELAATSSVKVADMHNSCYHFGQYLMNKLEAYLECPAEGMWYRELDKNLAWGERKWQVHGKVLPLTEFRQGKDGFWYVAFELAFDYGYIIDRFGIKQSDGKFLVRNAEKNHELRYREDNEILAFFSSWYESMKKLQSAAISDPTDRIGFKIDK